MVVRDELVVKGASGRHGPIGKVEGGGVHGKGAWGPIVAIGREIGVGGCLL